MSSFGAYCELCPVEAHLLSIPDVALMQDDNDEAADEDSNMEGELTSADYRKLQSLVDEQEQAVQAGDDILLDFANLMTCT